MEESRVHSGGAAIVKLAHQGLRHSLHRGSDDVVRDIKPFHSIYVPSAFPSKPKKLSDQKKHDTIDLAEKQQFSSFMQQLTTSSAEKASSLEGQATTLP